MDDAFDIMEFHRAKATALQALPLHVRAFRLAIAATIPPRVMVLAPRLAIALLTFCDEPDTTQAERDVLVMLTGRELATLFKLERFGPHDFGSIGRARATIQAWLRPYVEHHLDTHERHDRDQGARDVMASFGRRFRQQPAVQEDS